MLYDIISFVARLTAIIYGEVLKWSKRRDSKSRRALTRRVGSNPTFSAKKRQVSTCRFFIHCESNGISSRDSVHLITEGVYHQPQAVFAFAMMIYNTACW